MLLLVVGFNHVFFTAVDIFQPSANDCHLAEK